MKNGGSFHRFMSTLTRPAILPWFSEHRRPPASMPCSPRKSTVNGRHKPQRILCLSRPSHILCIEYYIYIYISGWWEKPTPPKNDGVKVSWGDEIPNIWKNKIHVPNHQPDTVYIYIYICMFFLLGLLGLACGVLAIYIYIYICICIYIYVLYMHIYIYHMYIYIIMYILIIIIIYIYIYVEWEFIIICNSYPYI